MMRFSYILPPALLLVCLFCAPVLCYAQATADSLTYQQAIANYQAELNAEYADPAHSPLEAADLANFVALPFYPIDSSYRIVAHFERTPGTPSFSMPTTTDRKPVYSQYAIVHFSLAGENISLPVYQNHDLREKEEYQDYLFLPFKDKTNGLESYGGGRYLDLRIPEGDSIVIDFNKAYNPYCAYSKRYSCPLVPAANRMPVAVKAGVLAPEVHE